MSNGRLARCPLRRTPDIRRLHRHRTRSSLHSIRIAVTTSDKDIRELTITKRKIEILPIFLDVVEFRVKIHV